MSLEDKIRNVIERHLDFVAANPNLPRFLVGEVFAYPERAQVLTIKIKQFAPHIIAELQRQIDEAAANGIFRKVVSASSVSTSITRRSERLWIKAETFPLPSTVTTSEVKRALYRSSSAVVPP